MKKRDLDREREERTDRLFHAFRDFPIPRQTEGGFYLSAEVILSIVNSDRRNLDPVGNFDLIKFVQEVPGAAGTPQDYIYMLPGLLKLWSEYVLWPDTSTYDKELLSRLELFANHFYVTLQRHQIIEAHLSSELREATTGFMREVIFDAFRQVERQQPGCWSRPLEVYPSIATEFEILWREWWEMPFKGYAEAAVLYASYFISVLGEEPLGYGQPWGQFKLHSLKCEGWLLPNVKFMQEVLSIEFLRDRLECAKLVLPERSEVIEQLLSLMETDSWRTEIRIEEFLTRLQQGKKPWSEWFSI